MLSRATNAMSHIDISFVFVHAQQHTSSLAEGDILANKKNPNNFAGVITSRGAVEQNIDHLTVPTLSRNFSIC